LRLLGRLTQDRKEIAGQAHGGFQNRYDREAPTETGSGGKHNRYQCAPRGFSVPPALPTGNRGRHPGGRPLPMTTVKRWDIVCAVTSRRAPARQGTRSKSWEDEAPKKPHTIFNHRRAIGTENRGQCRPRRPSFTTA